MALARPVWRSDYANSRQLSPLETFARASAASRMTKFGALAQAAANQPRFDYDPATMSCRGLLLEPSATNLGTQSEFPNGLSDAASQSGAVSAATMTGFAGAVAFTAAGANAWVYKNFAFAASTAYTVSVIVEMTDGLAPVFPSSTAAAASNDFGFSIANAGVAPQRVEYLGGIRYRVSASTTTGGAPSASWGVVKYSSNSSRTFKVTGYQLETGGVVTSYIPTTTAAVTRAADLLSVTGADFSRIWRTDEGTVICRGRSGVWGADRVLFSINDGGVNNRCVAYRASPTTYEVRVFVAGVTVLIQSIAGAADNADFALGVSFKAGWFLIALNGVSVAPPAPASFPFVTRLEVGHQLGAFQLSGHAGGIEVHARAATAAELIEVTR